MCTLKSNLLSATVLAVACAAIALLDMRTGMAAEGDKMERTVSVSATGSVTAEADVAQILAGVVTEGDSAKDAIGRNNIVMTKLVTGLKAAGIQAKDIQTATLNVEPRYTQPKDGRA